MFWDKSSFINVFLTVNVINIIKGFKIKSVSKKSQYGFLFKFHEIVT